MITVYLRDWYFNAGIIGFLNVLSEGKRKIDEINDTFENKLNISESFIEFDSKILDGFYDKYKRLTFDIFFNLDNYKERLNNFINKIKEPESKITKKLLQDTALNGKIVNEFFEAISCQNLNNIFSGKNLNKNEILKEVENIYQKLNQFNTNNDIYSVLKKANSSFIDYFLTQEVTKRIFSYKKVANYIDNTLNKLDEPRNNNQRCFICGKLKKKEDFSNAITQIIGFNSDNSNWIWGFNTAKTQICPLCALIYSCAIHGMVFLNRKIDKDYKTFFYTINRNTDISTLYHSFWLFKEKLKQKENQTKPFYTVLQEITFELINQKVQAVMENINFIEIAENQFGGHSTKGYNVYNYNISKELAELIKIIGIEGIPKGYYKDRNIYSDVTEEILKKTFNYTLNFSDLYSYFEFFLRSLEPKSKITTRFSISKICNYIIKYIIVIKGGNKMEQEHIVKKAFSHGKALAQKVNQENKIKGISYQLLNDLKIGDKNAFMDKYLRLCIGYGTEVKLGSNNELTDLDNFMSFGYSFVNGLLANLNKDSEKED